MAIFHLSVKAIGRANGRSATAAAAYRAATRIEDERTGLTHDYTRKTGVVHREIAVPDGAPPWVQDRAQLWNAAELAETRKNSTVAREFEVALPGELAAPERRHLAVALAQEIASRHRCAVDVAIHAPGRGGDNRNHHAHLLMTTRRLEASGFTEKTRELDDLKTGEVSRWRERWATLVNEHLEERGHKQRIDHRSLEAQGVDREATYHKGPAVTAIERRGEVARVTYRHQDDAAQRLETAAELGRLERESQALARSIIDTTADLRAVISGRDAERATSVDASAGALQPSMPDIRHDAQTQWLAQLAEQGRAERQNQSRDAVPALDLSGNVTSAARSRTTPVATVMREQAHAAWLIHRAEHTAEPSGAAKPAPGNETPRDDDHAL